MTSLIINIGMSNTPIRQIPGVATSAVSRRHREGGDGRSGCCATLLRTVARGGSVQFGVSIHLCVLSFCQVTEKGCADVEKAVWKRQIAVLRKVGRINDAVVELSKFADTFYTDVEAWLELADIYASTHQYAPLAPADPTQLAIIDTEPDMPRPYSRCPTSCSSRHRTRSMCSRPRKRHTQLKTSRWP